ncbi:hypothetical protein CYMTET_48159 [Cymbomonas tetramitiformis]|uniref:EF-hand domain-containing protein n=1 Tax=Cymbomonas tetramitiformis TaxID=36881 RepID=A0AAE0BUQ4_9CHLO|nr:hypothetical protein CYMTET_48159 [Cymbomonas tetramitiformis]
MNTGQSFRVFAAVRGLLRPTAFDNFVFGRSHIRDLRSLKIYVLENEAELSYMAERFCSARELFPGEMHVNRRTLITGLLHKLALLLAGHTHGSLTLQQSLEKLPRTTYGHVDPAEVLLLLLRWAPSLSLGERRQLSQYVRTEPLRYKSDINLWDLFRALRLRYVDDSQIIDPRPSRKVINESDDLALLPYRTPLVEGPIIPVAADDDMLYRPYSSYRHRYLKYTDPLLIEKSSEWEWVHEEVTFAGRRLLLDPVAGLVYEEPRVGDPLQACGKLEYGHIIEVEPMEQWNFIPTLSKRLHRQHSQVQQFFSTWGGGTTGGGGGVWLHPSSLRRLLRWLMPDISLSEVAALQAIVDTNRQGHLGRMELYHAVDDMVAVLQMPRGWLQDELRTALHRVAAHIGHSRRTALRTFDQYDSDMDGALRPSELMAMLKNLGPLLTSTERRRIATYAWSLTVIRDSRRVTQMEMMRALQMVQIRITPNGTYWPTLTPSERLTMREPVYLSDRPYYSPPYTKPLPLDMPSYATPPRLAYTPYTGTYKTSLSAERASGMGSSAAAAASSPLRMSEPFQTPAATIPAPDSSLVGSAQREVERAERSVHKLEDAENLLKEAVELYKAANDHGRQSAAEANLTKVGTLLKEARYEKAEKSAKLGDMRMDYARHRMDTP